MTDTKTDPIHAVLEKWHLQVRGQLPGGLGSMLHDDVIFYSPVVFTPQVGKDITMLYLAAAGGVFGGDENASEKDGADSADHEEKGMNVGGSFRYTKEVASGHNAVLEFETEMEGKHVNGVDIITCDDDGMITEFRVMIRPLQAVNAVHQNMMQMLERMQPGAD